MPGCVNLAAFHSVSILTMNMTKASFVQSQLCPEIGDLIRFHSGVRPADTGCENPRKDDGIYAGHINVLSSIVYNGHFEAGARRWHLILEDDAVAGEFALTRPTWFTETVAMASPDTEMINLGPNDIALDWSHIGDAFRWSLSRTRLTVLPKFGVLLQAYAVTDVGAAIIVNQLKSKQCVGIIDIELSALSDRLPTLAMRAFYKHQRPQPYTIFNWGIFGQRRGLWPSS